MCRGEVITQLVLSIFPKVEKTGDSARCLFIAHSRIMCGVVCVCVCVYVFEVNYTVEQASKVQSSPLPD